MKFDVQVDGLRHLEQAMLALSVQAQRKAMVGALRDAGRPMVRQAKTAYRTLGGSGSLAQAMSVWQRRKGTGSRSTFASVELGPKRGNRAALARYYSHYRKQATPRSLIAGVRHGHLVEFGFTHRSGRAVPGKGILQGIIQRSGQAAIQDFGRFLGARIEREARRQGARQGVGR